MAVNHRKIARIYGQFRHNPDKDYRMAAAAVLDWDRR